MNEEHEADLIFFKLSKSGYGSVNEIAEWDTRRVLQCLAYEKFTNDFEEAYLQINKDN